MSACSLPRFRQPFTSRTITISTHDADARGDAAADHHCVVVDRRRPTSAPASALWAARLGSRLLLGVCRPNCGRLLVLVVEERQKVLLAGLTKLTSMTPPAASVLRADRLQLLGQRAIGRLRGRERPGAANAGLWTAKDPGPTRRPAHGAPATTLRTPPAARGSQCRPRVRASAPPTSARRPRRIAARALPPDRASRGGRLWHGLAGTRRAARPCGGAQADRAALGGGPRTGDARGAGERPPLPPGDRGAV